MNQEDAQLVFVYGTLRIGEENHWLLEDSRLVARTCWTNGILVDTGHGYPAIVGRNDAGTLPVNERIYGELYHVTPGVLEKLDELEDYHGPGHVDNLYDRLEQTVYSDTRAYVAYVYIWADKHGSEPPVIATGDWKNR